MQEEERRDYFYLAGKNPEYDQVAKKLLSSKKILAWILKYCVEEFKDSEVADIRDRYIQGIPEVASTPVLPDRTNAGGSIRGEANEDISLTEGQVTFDIRFRAITPDDEPIELIINIEAQKSSRLPYPLLKRAMYYCSRLISSQHDVDFTKSHYEKIKKVYSIWLCMDTPDERSGITRYKMQEETEFGEYRVQKSYYDLQQVVMVYIGQAKRDLGNRLLNLLSDLFKSDANASVKLNTLKEKYDINLSQSEEGMVDTMCDLSVGVFERAWNAGMKQGLNEGLEKGMETGMKRGMEKGMERGLEKGLEKGMEKGMENANRLFVMHLLQEQMPLSFILRMTGCTEEFVRQVAEKENLQVKE